jgi:hypothetical protein
MGDVAAAIRRIEESRRSHAEWAEHIPNCGHCQKHGPPAFIQSLEEHQQIVAEYDNVLACLRAVLPVAEVSVGG